MIETKKSPEWIEDTQRVILALALKSDLLDRAGAAVNAATFGAIAGANPPRARIAGMIAKVWEKGRRPSIEELEQLVYWERKKLGPAEGDAIAGELRAVVTTDVSGDVSWAVQSAREWSEYQRLAGAIVQAADILAAGPPGVARAREALLSGAPTDGDGLVVRRFDEIQEASVDWLWTDHIARGSVTLLCGDPGLGKSKVTLDLAARHSRGAAWPDGSSGGEAGSAIVLSAEDNAEYTMKPRLIASNADQSRIALVDGVRDRDGERSFSLGEDLPMLERLIVETGADLVIVDPLSAYLGKVDSFKDAELRRVLGPVAKLAERLRVAVVGVMHLTKSQDRTAIMRLQGSVAFPAAARLVFGVVPDKQQEGDYLLVAMKSNICAKAPAIVFAHDGVGIRWGRSVALTEAATEELFQKDKARSAPKLEPAKKLLLEAVPGRAKKIEERAKTLGISASTLTRAREELGVESTRIGFGPDAWVLWEMPQTSGNAAPIEPTADPA